MKKLLLATILLGALYSQCNESNWQEYYPNMSGCNLEGAYLEGVNFSGADLTGANLIDADLTGANLIDANLSGADLYQSKFIYALLTRANFEWTYIHHVDMVGANLSCANLSGAYFYLTNLTNTIWNECGIADNNGDGYDDVSYEAGAESVDINSDGLVDEYPVITVLDGDVQILTQSDDDEYTDSGAICQDAQDGSLSHAVEVSGQVVNLRIIGAYTIYYNCADSDGNQAITESRTVIVQADYSDENDDGYDDISYEAGAESGDLNLDGIDNVLDVVILVNNILNP